MNHKFKIATLIACIVFALGFWFLWTDKSAIEYVVPTESSVTIQLIPSPMIINGSKKDSRLYELLVNKEDAKVTLPNVDIDIEPIFMATPVALKNLSVIFNYNKQTNRVEFQGQSNGHKYMKIFGHYEFTSKNNIRYYISIRDKSKTWVIDSTYAPPYHDNDTEHGEVIVGNFLLETSDLLRATYDFDISSNRFIPKWPLVIKGNFVKEENSLNIKDFYLKASEVEASMTAKVEGKKLMLDAAINEINLDKILPYLPVGEVDRLLSVVFKNIAEMNITGTLNCNKVTFNGTDLKSFLIAFSQKEKAKKNLKIEKLSFVFPDSSEFQSSGKISRIGENLGIDGSFSIANTKSNILAKALGLGNYSGSSLVSLSSKFELTPSMLKLKNLKVKEEAAVVTGGLSFSKYVSTKMLTGNVEVSNYSTNPASFIQYVLYKNALSSGGQGVNYELALKQNRKEKFLKDITLKFVDLKTTAGIVEKISVRYIQTPSSIELEQFKAEDPKFNVQGGIKFSSKEGIPKLDVNFEGDKVDMSIFNDVIFKPFMYQRSVNYKDHVAFSVPRFDSATGDIRINLKNPDNKAYVSEVNCIAKLDKQTLMLNDCFVVIARVKCTSNARRKCTR
jgi:hypothetical protein